MTIICILISIFYAAVAAQTSSVGVVKPKDGSKGRIYQNYLYNLSFETPAGWTEISSDDSKFLAEAGKEILKPNQKGEAELEKSMQLTQVLLHITKFPLGMPENASFICAVEVNQTPQATIAQTAVATQQSFVKDFGFTVISPAKQTTLGDRIFFSIKMKKAVGPEITVYQSIYLRKIGDKVLQFVLTYTKPEDGNVMEKSLQTLKFTK